MVSCKASNLDANTKPSEQKQDQPERPPQTVRLKQSKHPPGPSNSQTLVATHEATSEAQRSEGATAKGRMGEKDLKRGESLDGWQSREVKRKLLPLLVAVSGLLLSGCGSSGGSSSTPKPPAASEILGSVQDDFQKYLRVTLVDATNGMQADPSCTYNQADAAPGYEFDCYIDVTNGIQGTWTMTIQARLLLPAWSYVFTVTDWGNVNSNYYVDYGDTTTQGPLPVGPLQTNNPAAE